MCHATASGPTLESARRTLGCIFLATLAVAVVFKSQPACRAGELFAENFDGGPGLPFGWTTSFSGAGTGWQVNSGTNDTPPSAMFVSDLATYSQAELVSPPMVLPTPACRLRFRHHFSTESCCDRGLLEISIAGGPFNDITSAGGLFITNGYPTYSTGWGGNSGGFITTELFLPATAAGQSIQLRWRFTSDGSGGGLGWFMDTVSVSDGQILPPDDISITVADSADPIAVGVNLTYFVRVTNTGPSTATAVLLTNVLPAGAAFVSATPSVGTCSNLNGTIVCNFGVLAGNSQATLAVVVQPTANGVLTNRASVTRAEPDVYLLNNNAIATTTVSSPVLYPGIRTAAEGDAGTTEVGLTVTLSPASPQTVTVNYATTNGTAAPGSDYLSRTGTLTFAPGETLKTIMVPVMGDELDEDNETFSLHLSGPTNASVITNLGVTTILDDDEPPYLFMLDSAVTEGNSGSTAALFPVYLSEASGRTVSVGYATSSGTASSPWDFTATNGMLVFPPGTTLQTIAITINPDTARENSEYFAVQFQSLMNANWFNSSVYGWILNDDGLPGELHHFSWGQITNPVFVGQSLPVTLIAKDYFNSTVSNFTGTVGLSATMVGGNADRTILSSPSPNTDYTYPQTAGYAFTPNTNIVVTHVRHYSGARVSIWTDDGTLIASQAVASTPGVWNETELALPIALSAGTRYRVAVYRENQSLYLKYTLPSQFPDGTIDQGYYSYDDDFPQYSSGELWLVDLRYTVGSLQSVAIAPVQSGNFVNGIWSGDITPLDNGTGVRLKANDAPGHIGFSDRFDISVTNDISVKIAVSPDPVGTGAPLSYQVTVKNSGPLAATGVMVTNFLPAGVTFLSASASQGTATNLAGLVLCNLGALPATSSAVLTINILVGGAGALTNVATVSRAEPDLTPVNNTAEAVTSVVESGLIVDDVAVVEGNSGFAAMNFVVRLSTASGYPVMVNYATGDDAAMAGSDYVATNGTLYFAPGQTSRVASVQVKGDFLNEEDESLFLNLSSPSNATLVKAQAAGQIWNDDPLPILLIQDVSVKEGNAGPTNAIFTVTMTSPSSRPVSGDYVVYGGTAWSPTDFILTNGALFFPPGETVQTIVVTVNGDTAAENTETFNVDLGWPVNAVLGNYQATGFIVNDDGLPGQLHHFAWDNLASPQYLGQPFAATVTARDYFDNIVSNYTGPASLSGYAITSETSGTILGAPTHSFADTPTPYTLGYSFTPNTDLIVTHVRHYFGSKVSIWTEDGNLLASQVVTSVPGTWKETALSSPVRLSAGVRYLLGVYAASGNRYWRSDGPATFAHGTIDQAFYAYGDAWPNYYDYARWWFVDLAYVVQTLQPVALQPAATGGFTGGQWTGSMTLMQTADAMFLRADDGAGLFGLSDLFGVTAVELGISRIGGDTLLHWPAGAPDFVLESAGGLTSPLWKTLTNAPVIVDGLNVVTNPITTGQEIFRLRRQ